MELKVSKADLLAAAWLRYEAARDAIYAREQLALAVKPLSAARDRYQQALYRSKEASTHFADVEGKLLQQECYGPHDVAQPVRA